MYSHNSASDESDVSDSSGDARSTFRVSVCLQRYFGDVRARAYVLASRRRRVRWLQQRIQKLFALPGACCLRVAGHLLPPAEPLALLTPEDRVEVIPLQDGRINEQEAIKENEELQSSQVAKVLTSFSAGCALSYYGGVVSNKSNTSVMTINDTTNDRLLGSDSVDAVTEPNIPAKSPRLKRNGADSALMNSHDWAQTDVDCQALKTLKRQALALLDTHCAADEGADCAAAEEGPVPKRARRRVRRRVRRPPPASTPCVSEPSAEHVARNEDACARKPRLVHALDIDTC